MPDSKVFHPYLLAHGDQPAMEFSRAGYDSTLAANLQYEQGDLVIVHTDGNVRKATGTAGTLGLLSLAGQPHEGKIPEQYLPPNDGSNPHWFFQRGVPLNHIPEEHFAVFALRGGSGANVANGTDYAATATDIANIAAQQERTLHYDTTEGCHVISHLTATPNVRMLRVLRRGDEAGDLNVHVVCRILPAYLRK